MSRVDFHTHTYYSYDSIMKPARILEIARKRGLSAIVINDHNTIRGGLEAKKINPYTDLEVIVGAEIKTDAGDITGIFLQSEIQSRSFREVADEIHGQGGLVILNHPFVGHKLDLIDFNLIDLVEGYNSRLSPEKNQMAVELAKKHNKPVISGSDAHVYSEIGRCYTEYSDQNWLKPKDCNYRRTGYFTIPFSQFIKAFKKKDLKLALSLVLFTPKLIFKRLLE